MSTKAEHAVTAIRYVVARKQQCSCYYSIAFAIVHWHRWLYEVVMYDNYSFVTVLATKLAQAQ